MQLRLTFDEISNLIEQKSGKRLPIIYGGPHTIRIAYEVNLFIKSASIGLDLTIEEINNEGIILSYNGGSGIDYVVKMALSHAQSQPGGDMIENLDNNKIRLNLSKNAQTGTLLDHIELKDVFFDERYATIEFTPKV